MYTREYLLKKAKREGILRVVIILPSIAILYTGLMGLVCPELFWKIMSLSIISLSIMVTIALILSNKMTESQATQDMMVENQLKMLLKKKKIDNSNYEELLDKLYKDEL